MPVKTPLYEGILHTLSSAPHPCEVNIILPTSQSYLRPHKKNMSELELELIDLGCGSPGRIQSHVEL